MRFSSKTKPPLVVESGDDWNGVPSGMSATVAAMINSLQEAGEDDHARLVTADAFQDAGLDQQANFIRRQVADLQKEPMQHNGIRLSSPRHWSAPELEEGGAARVTIEGLLNLKPWECNQWYTTTDTKFPRNCGRIEVASAATRRKGPYRFPAVTWYRGFLHSIHNISPQVLFRYVESGQHAWHPWTFGKPADEVAAHWLTQLEGFTTTAFPDGRTDGGSGYQFHVSYRDYFGQHRGPQWYAGKGKRPNHMAVVPYPITVLMGSGPRLEKEPRKWHVPYSSSGEALTQLTSAMRWFVHYAAYRSRCKVIERGGT